MNILGLARFALASSPLTMVRTLRVLNETYRAAFVSTAASEGVLELLRSGPRSGRSIHDALGLERREADLEAWLDLGVALGELSKGGGGYGLRGGLARALSKPENDVPLAYLQARIAVIFDYVTGTPARLRAGERFTLDDSIGELFARSSRTVEPLLLDVVDRVVPEAGPCRLLEVGCGSGIYLRRACERNGALEAVGLELSAQAADFARRNLLDWGLAERVRVETIDVRDFSDDDGYDLLTFYNLIYYFPEELRVELLRHLRGLLRPEGRLILTSLVQAKDVATRTMDLWARMTEGCGSLPEPSQLRGQLEEAGFQVLAPEPILGNYQLFLATRP